MSTVILSVGLLVFIGHLMVGLFKKTRIPDVLLLTLLGIVLGPEGLGLVLGHQLGVVGSVFSQIALIVILFEGGVNMDLRAISKAIGDSSGLTFTTFAVSLVAVATLTQSSLGWSMAFILGAVLAGTSSAVVIPMVSSLKLGDRTRVALSLESALTDVLCIVGVYALLESQISGRGLEAMDLIGQISSKLVMASILGVFGGIAWLVVLGKVRQIPNTQFTVFGLAFVLYGLADVLGYSGAIASLVFGITIANVKPQTFKTVPFLDRLTIAMVSASERSLFGEAVFLVKILFFVYLGISLPFSRLEPFLVGGAIVATIYAARLLIVRFSLPSTCDRRDAMIAAIMVPKGLAAAILATLPLQFALPHGELIRDIAFAVVFESIILTSLLVPIFESPFVSNILEATLFRPFSAVGKTNALPVTIAETRLIDIFELTAQMQADQVANTEAEALTSSAPAAPAEGGAATPPASEPRPTSQTIGEAAINAGRRQTPPISTATEAASTEATPPGARKKTTVQAEEPSPADPTPPPT